MSAELSQNVRPQTNWLKWLGAFAGFFVAAAAFDLRLANYEIATYILQTTLPFWMLVLVLVSLVLAIRVKIHVLMMRHKVLTIAVFALLGYATFQITSIRALTSTGQRRADLKIYQGGLPAVREQLRLYFDQQESLFSRTAWVRSFHRDMAFRASHSFRHFDFTSAISYLNAADENFKSYNSNASSEGALNYLQARQRYLKNHDARIASIEKQGGLSPLLTYLYRTTYTLDPTPDRKTRLLGHVGSLSVASSAAKDALELCTKKTGLLQLSNGSLQILSHIAEASEEFPSPRKDIGVWCENISQMENASDEPGAIVERYKESFNAHWGDWKKTPKRVMWFDNSDNFFISEGYGDRTF